VDNDGKDFRFIKALFISTFEWLPLILIWVGMKVFWSRVVENRETCTSRVVFARQEKLKTSRFVFTIQLH
jgi:hypothetical protein